MVRESRGLWLLLAMLIGQFILLSAQVDEPGSERTRLEGAALRVVAPFPHLVAAVGGALDGIGERLRTRSRLAADNRRLREEVEELRRERVRLFGIEEDLAGLSRTLDYQRPENASLRLADIVYIDHLSWLQTLVLYVGEGGARRDQPVVSAEGLVGRVILPSGPYAKVQLLTDRAASVGAMIRRTRRQGVVRGAEGGGLEMDFVPLQVDVRVGDEVVTAGIDGIFGRGLPVGTVTHVEPGRELFLSIRLRPAVDFGALDQVYLLEREPVPEVLKEPVIDAQP